MIPFCWKRSIDIIDIILMNLSLEVILVQRIDHKRVSFKTKLTFLFIQTKIHTNKLKRTQKTIW